MIWPSKLALEPEPAVDRRQPVDDPLPDGAPLIDDPSRELPAVDPRRRDAPEPVSEPRYDPSEGAA